MSPRRVLMTADAVGGVWTYALDLARGLTGHGVEVLLAVEGQPPDTAQRAAAAAIDGLEMVETGIELEWRDRGGALAAVDADRLRTLAEGFAPDIVHLNGYRDALLDWRVPVVVAAHSCVRSWWWACHGGEPPEEWRAYGRAVAQGLAMADAVAVPTEAFARELGRLYGPLPQAQVIPNGRDARPAPAPARLPMVLTVGRLWDEAKSLGTIEAAAPHLPWPVVAAGAMPEQAPRHVHPTGRLAERTVLALMAHAEIYAAPACYEPFGLANLEAAGAGCAMVLGDIPSQRELWGDSAAFVAPGDVDGLAGTLRALARDPERREKLRRRSTARAAGLGAGRMTAAYLGLYRRLLASPRREAAS